MQGLHGNVPEMVETKMESSVQAWMLIPAGMGTKNRSASPMATDANSGSGLAPCNKNPSGKGY